MVIKCMVLEYQGRVVSSVEFTCTKPYCFRFGSVLK